MEPRELKVVAVGDPSKVELLFTLNDMPLNEHRDFENYTREMTINNYKIHVWDTAGQAEYDRLRPLSYAGANVILLVFDLSSKATFSNLSEKWMKEVAHYCKDAKILLIGINLDLRQAGNPNHVTDQEAEQFVKENKCTTYIPCSSRTCERIDKIWPSVITAFKTEKESCIICENEFIFFIYLFLHLDVLFLFQDLL